MTERTAFAVEGLGGNNAHGAGFLAAAQTVQRRRNQSDGDLGPDADGSRRRSGNGAGAATATGDQAVRSERARRAILPELEFVSCTSGGIASTAAYLRGDDIGAEVEAQIEAVERASGLPRAAWAEPWRAPIVTLLTGLPGVFGPWAQAFREHIQERLVGFLTPGSPRFGAVPTTADEWFDLWMPARTFVPERPMAFFEETATTFNDPAHGVGVACNSFEPETGLERLYVNAAGMDRIRDHADPGAEYGSEHNGTVYDEITGDGLVAALWLFFYGFRRDDVGTAAQVDGAYTRSIILDELTFADRIYAVKPINHRWLGPLPSNLLDVQDMQTKLWMSISYREQRRLIQTVNKLLASQPLAAGEKRYHHVDLVPVEIAVQRGFFSYFIEDRGVYRDAYNQSLEVLAGSGRSASAMMGAWRGDG